MDENALGFASYWRNSLADAESGKGSFERKDAKNFTHWHGIAAGRLDEAIVSKFFEGEKNLASSISIAKFAYNKYVNSENATGKAKDFNSSFVLRFFVSAIIVSRAICKSL